MSDTKDLPAKREESWIPAAAIRALQHGKAASLVEAFREHAPEHVEERLAQLAIAIRRESVATLGSHEAFVRLTPEGALHQVIKPVKLSMTEGTLYKIAKRGQVDGVWQDVWPVAAQVTYPGLMKQNGVAGCNIGQPPEVMVDGKPRTNPYVQRARAPGGRLGDIVRVVISVVVVGPAPATGNPVVVTYTLDYDPAKDLLHMLAGVADKVSKSCYLMNEDEYKVLDPKPPGWKFIPLFGGVGYHFELGIKEIRRVYKDFINISQNAVKKAQTVARRNAMKSHPAFVTQVIPDSNGIATLAVVGWAGDSSTMQRWRDIQARLAKGQDLGLDEADHIVVDAEYEPDRDDERPPEDAQESAPALTPEEEEKAALIARIDEGLQVVPADAIAGLNYDPENQGPDELREVLNKLNAVADGAGEDDAVDQD